MKALPFTLVCTLLFPLAASAQTTQKTPLAEVARKEAERRKVVKPAQKVITAKDLPESAKKPASSTAAAGAQSSTHGAEGAAPAAPAAGGAAPAGAPEGDAKDEQAWRKRIAGARENLRRTEAFAEALQSRINALTADFSSRDNPVQRAKIGEDRVKALEELARVKSDVEQARRAIDDVEEEARKAGVPPGWLR